MFWIVILCIAGASALGIVEGCIMILLSLFEFGVALVSWMRGKNND